MAIILTQILTIIFRLKFTPKFCPIFSQNFGYNFRSLFATTKKLSQEFKVQTVLHIVRTWGILEKI